MQRDQLENFIIENREAFDEATPSLDVWGGIDEAISKRRSRRISMWRTFKIAASVVLLLTCGVLLGRYIPSDNIQQEAVVDLSEIYPELAEMEKYYQKQFQQKYQRLVRLNYDPAVDEEVAQLDKVMEELKKELLQVPKGNEEKVVNDLLRTYQAKVRILEKVLENIQPSVPKENNKNGDDEISI